MYWNWLKSGIALAACFLLAVVLIKPIGVSTQFVIFDGIVASAFNDSLVVEEPANKSGFASSNAYLDKSGGKYAKSVANPISYGLVFVIAMIGGGFLASRYQSERAPSIPRFHQSRFGDSAMKRYLLAFIGGVIVLFGARLAGGCTSGHMMSGMMQTAVSGYLFTVAALTSAIPTAILLYRNGGNEK